MDAAVQEVRERPRSSLHFLFQRLAEGDTSVRAMAGHLIAASAGGRGGDDPMRSDIVDNLNALVFDAAQPAEVKVLANDLLGRLGSPVDPDVFNMTVPEAGRYADRLPSRALERLAEGDVEAAVEHARSLHPVERFLVMQ